MEWKCKVSLKPFRTDLHSVRTIIALLCIILYMTVLVLYFVIWGLKKRLVFKKRSAASASRTAYRSLNGQHKTYPSVITEESLEKRETGKF